jgi:hypothetical protein
MPGAILQLAATGVQDAYLTENPEINVFKYSYYRYVNFATEVVEINLDNPVKFGSQTSIVIPPKGHLLSKIYLNIKLPVLEKVDGTYACWTDTFGYAIFSQPVELLINGVIVDRLYPACMDMLNELTSSSKKKGLDQMILKSDIYRSTLYNSTRDVELMIPLDFWFTKQYNMALPLVSMMNQEIKLNFYFKPFTQMINYDGNIEPIEVNIIDSNLFVEYIYLDDLILQQFTTQSHQYLINQIVYHGDEYISSGQTLYSTKIDFKNPCKEILFACIDTANLEINNHFNYSRQDEKSFVSQIGLLLDNKHRYDDFKPESIFRQFYPNNVHTVITQKHFYTLPFSLECDTNQPQGSLNLSRFDNVLLSLKLNENNPRTLLKVFGMVYNIVTIQNGALKMEWFN